MAADAAASVARAKVNLSLHVLGRRPDGYHRLDSLVVFPEIGDFIEAEPSAGLSLALDGPQGFALDAGPDNLVLRAAGALRDALGTPDHGAALRLEKRLPISSGIGGGSTDAATTLKLLNELWQLGATEERLAEIGLAIGADLPVCLAAPRASWMREVGEDVSPGPSMPGFWLVLVNPGVAVSTPEVFRALAGRFGPAPEAAPDRFGSLDALVDWLAAARNDLEAPAISLAPPIAEVLEALRAAPGCRLARMSGSGATCWGIFGAEAAALDASAAIGAAHPGWWTATGPVDD